MQLSIRFTRPTVKLLDQHLKGACDAAALRSVRRISALLDPAKGESVKQVADTWPQILQQAKEKKAMILCQGEAGFMRLSRIPRRVEPRC